MRNDHRRPIHSSRRTGRSGVRSGSGSKLRSDTPPARPGTLAAPGAETSVAAVTPRAVLEWIALVVPPTTLVTALAFWFGLTLTSARSAYFGIDYSTLGFAASDYILRSTDALFVPVAVVLLLVLASLGVQALVTFLIKAGLQLAAIRAVALIVLLFASATTLVGVWSMFRPLPFPSHYLLPPVLLGGGAAWAAYAFSVLRAVWFRNRNDQRNISVWERSGYLLVAMLVTLSLFWAASLYAAALGRGKAQDLERNLQDRPGVTVFSKQSLGLGPPVKETVIGNQEAAYRFRYSGLRLVIRSAGKYFLLSEGWTREAGVAVVLNDGPDLRLEFTPGGVR